MLGFRIVPQAHAIVVERLGKFNRVLYSGIQFVMPFLEQTRPIYYRAIEITPDGKRTLITKRSHLIDLREQILDFPSSRSLQKTASLWISMPCSTIR